MYITFTEFSTVLLYQKGEKFVLSFIFSVLTTRELAACIWVLFLIICFTVFLIKNKSIRVSFVSALKSLFDWKLTKYWLLMILYFIALTCLFLHSRYWNLIYVKDIIVWFIFSGIKYCVDALKQETDIKYLSRVVIDNFKFDTLVLFLINTFTFDFWIEFFLIPLLSIICIMSSVASKNEKYRNVSSFLSNVIFCIGMIIIGGTVYGIYKSIGSINVTQMVISCSIPFLYTIFCVPVLYLIFLISTYDTLFFRMSLKMPSYQKVDFYKKIQVFKVCHFSVSKIKRFQNDYVGKMYSKMTKDEFHELLNEFKVSTKK